jgi:hypothetical protein
MTSMRGSLFGRLLLLWMLVMVAACSHQSKRVDCEGKFVPINAVTPTVGIKSAKVPEARP